MPCKPASRSVRGSATSKRMEGSFTVMSFAGPRTAFAERPVLILNEATKLALQR